MYDIRQFRPALYTLIMLGMTGFALASQSPGLWVLSTGAILLNAWLVMTGRFRPLPRYLANLVTLLALVYMAMIVGQAMLTPILVVGQFLVFLQIVKLFEQRANRDYAQLLVLSLLLMVAASISTASLIFGLLLVIYLFLSLYCCLLFHLKVETDHAKAAIGVPEETLNPATLRQDQRYLSRSMRRLTLFVSVVSVTLAVVVFLFFPRGSAGAFMGPLQFRSSQTLTGFNDQLSFQNIAAITQNQQLVAYVTLWHNDQKVEGTAPLLLRGTTLDVYHGNEDGSVAWQWTRTNTQAAPIDLRPGIATYPSAGRRIRAPQRWRQEITLQPTGTTVLFGMAGIREIIPYFDGRVQFSDYDQVLQTIDIIQVPLRYTVISTGRLQDNGVPQQRLSSLDLEGEQRPRPRPRSNIDPRIEELARQASVSGADAAGSFASRRPKDERATPLDVQIARNIETYLRTNYSYTLDLTDARRTNGQDPMVAFLYDFKRGHCEYFAGAMTLMCQSLGLQARAVVGFKCDDYNNIGGYYMVRQSHAHAWVEVLGDDREWHTFDPTSARNAPPPAPTTWTRLQHLFNYLEFTWANSVIAYDREQRNNVITAVNDSLSDSAVHGSQALEKLKKALTPDTDLVIEQSKRVVSWLIGIMSAAVVLAVLWYLFERWKLRRRARRIGLTSLPHPLQLKLARQLGFYDDLIRLLARHGIHRPNHLTPMEFSGSLSFLPHEAFDTIRRLTEVFYRVRFGQTQLTADQRRRLGRVIERVDDAMNVQ